jgi:hypothetical protein
MEVKFFKVNTLPGTLQSNSWYLVANGTYAETYVTDNTGTAKMVGNSTMINALIASQLSGLNQTYVVADIAARNTLTATLTRNAVIQVINATGDTTVSSGGATYLWDDANNISVKISEFESMDVTLNWTNIVGKPASSPGAIDAAVTNSHTHTNKTTLDGISDVAGRLNYGGDDIKNWNLVNW